MKLTAAVDYMIRKDEKGLTFLYDHYGGALKGIIIRIVGSEAIAEEILQETFMKIWTNFGRYDSTKSTLFTWMARIARNCAIDQKRLKRFEHLSNTTTLNVAHHDSSITDNHSKLDVISLTKPLDEKYKVVLDCIYLKGYTHKEASDLLNLPIGTIKSRLRKSISILRESLQNEKTSFTSALFLYLLISLILWI